MAAETQRELNDMHSGVLRGLAFLVLLGCARRLGD